MRLLLPPLRLRLLKILPLMITTRSDVATIVSLSLSSTFSTAPSLCLLLYLRVVLASDRFGSLGFVHLRSCSQSVCRHQSSTTHHITTDKKSVLRLSDPCSFVNRPVPLFIHLTPIAKLILVALVLMMAAAQKGFSAAASEVSFSTQRSTF